VNPTVQFKDQYGEIISKILEDFFYGLIYEPLIGVVNKWAPGAIKLSGQDPDEMPLMRKIQDGKIIYDGEYFTGSFDARSSRIIRELGGRWDPLKKAFKMSPGKLTENVKVAVRASQERSERIHDGLTNEIGNIESRIDPEVDELDLSQGIDKVIDGLQTQTINAMKAIGVPYTLTHRQREALRLDYSDNMKLYIRGWAEEHIKTLRKEVQANALAGYRFGLLKDALQYRYGTSEAKAQFLARQETSLFMSKFRRERFLDAGVSFYIWQTVGDRKVRADHRALNRRVFQFGDPPVVDVATGRKAEPGEDFNCRCVARPTTKPVHKVGSEWKIVDE
jgi:SPP1 gp7 family putative phage head morphogenesis protein